MENTVRCQCCQEQKDREEMEWTYDRYGTPFKLVCWDCYDKVDKEIKAYMYDKSYAGEDYYEEF